MDRFTKQIGRMVCRALPECYVRSLACDGSCLLVVRDETPLAHLAIGADEVLVCAAGGVTALGVRDARLPQRLRHAVRAAARG